MCTLGIEIAGIRVAVHVDDSALESRVREKYAAFLTESRDAACVVHAVVRNGVGVPPLGEIWRVETEMYDNRLTYHSLYDEGWMDWRSSTGEVVLRPGTDMENYLRVIFAYLSARSEGVLLHASSVARDGRAFVFVGPSGSGKSTVAHLSLDAGMTVFGDDIVIVRRINGIHMTYSVPFRGSAPRSPQVNAAAPLGGVFSLVKSEAHGLNTLDHPTAIARIVQCVPFVMSDPAMCATVLGTCRDIVRSTRVGSLNFRKDYGFWSVLNEPLGPISHPA